MLDCLVSFCQWIQPPFLCEFLVFDFCLCFWFPDSSPVIWFLCLSFWISGFWLWINRINRLSNSLSLCFQLCFVESSLSEHDRYVVGAWSTFPKSYLLVPVLFVYGYGGDWGWPGWGFCWVQKVGWSLGSCRIFFGHLSLVVSQCDSLPILLVSFPLPRFSK